MCQDILVASLHQPKTYALEGSNSNTFFKMSIDLYPETMRANNLGFFLPSNELHMGYRNTFEESGRM